MNTTPCSEQVVNEERWGKHCTGGYQGYDQFSRRMHFDGIIQPSLPPRLLVAGVCAYELNAGMERISVLEK